jgi:hypothetical protein
MPLVSEAAVITITPGTQKTWTDLIQKMSELFRELADVLRRAFHAVAELFDVLRETQRLRGYPGSPVGFARHGLARGLPQTPHLRR